MPLNPSEQTPTVSSARAGTAKPRGAAAKPFKTAAAIALLTFISFQLPFIDTP
jgi:hypothetical protein